MLTVVVVDDYAGFRAMARVLLTGGGFVVVGEAATGAQALVLVATLAPESVLLDVQLPDMDGFTVCRALRARGCTARVVLCSVLDPADYGSGRIADSGADGFLAKADLTVEAFTAIVRGR